MAALSSDNVRRLNPSTIVKLRKRNVNPKCFGKKITANAGKNNKSR